MTMIDWIAADWGTSHLRVWGMASDTVVHAAESGQGMSRLTRAEFEPALLALTSDWLPEDRITPVVACGMLGSQQGWVEAPYTTVPCVPLGNTLACAPTRDLRLSVHVVPGLKQLSPADVMRGEETQVAGFLARNPGWDGVICLPGTHSKWVHVSAGEVVSFQTFMTGEIFALLSEHSILRHSVSGWDEQGFVHGFDQGMERPERLLARLFSIRAETLLQGQDAAFARARLSGLLIGAELAASKPYWLGQRVAVIGAQTIAHPYATALARLSVPVGTYDATELTLAGLFAARAFLPQDQTPCAH
ncbi:MAG: 2-dehydro-3-deoxygalactonokinase [Rhodobacteraceae bacterium]|nr:2-dehydro-3-deoxygalactonokinase [Paracoccaceae bacterium]